MFPGFPGSYNFILTMGITCADANNASAFFVPILGGIKMLKETVVPKNQKSILEVDFAESCTTCIGKVKGRVPVVW